VFLALDWRTALATLLVFVIVFAFTRYVSLASVIAAAAFPLFGFHFVTQHTPMVWFGFLFIPALIIAKHHGNIRRLINGTESRFGSKSKSGADHSTETGSPRKEGA
jgi:glycerol-3-phosphate acyltransferase PlsY